MSRFNSLRIILHLRSKCRNFLFSNLSKKKTSLVDISFCVQCKRIFICSFVAVELSTYSTKKNKTFFSNANHFKILENYIHCALFLEKFVKFVLLITKWRFISKKLKLYFYLNSSKLKSILRKKVVW